MRKKNEGIRSQNQRKELQSTLSPKNQHGKKSLPSLIRDSQEEIMELSQPFKVIFENAVADVSLQITQ